VIYHRLFYAHGWAVFRKEAGSRCDYAHGREVFRKEVGAGAVMSKGGADSSKKQEPEDTVLLLREKPIVDLSRVGLHQVD
jgi:hypothetical protein